MEIKITFYRTNPDSTEWWVVSRQGRRVYASSESACNKIAAFTRWFANEGPEPERRHKTLEGKARYLLGRA